MAQLAAHRMADKIVQGRYWFNGRGCAIGCITHDPDGGHRQFPKRFGIPEHLAWLADAIFELLPAPASDWPERFAGAIKPGADLSSVWPRFAIWLLSDQKWGALAVASSESVRAGCQQVAQAYERIAEGGQLSAAEQRATSASIRSMQTAWSGAARIAYYAWAARPEKPADSWDPDACWHTYPDEAAHACRSAAAAARYKGFTFAQASAQKLVGLLKEAR